MATTLASPAPTSDSLGALAVLPPELLAHFFGHIIPPKGPLSFITDRPNDGQKQSLRRNKKEREVEVCRLLHLV
jgi:hypothetical protein